MLFWGSYGFYGLKVYMSLKRIIFCGKGGLGMRCVSLLREKGEEAVKVIRASIVDVVNRVERRRIRAD